ncbi:L-serine ammonia-lyase, iron-sulfur-dependent subunit beta [Veillonella intestinalis]|uniref:L-serine ammonia-lyase, iron-sulfur-dependent subunit beta n=1 Tax=Veillonella intestinalis TaxID=2941341 RepID=UPI00203BD198|nr:L-serine ammonia-lyase, iron-sulfur-dependent subunit beta [Veillonella intestinalis]
MSSVFEIIGPVMIGPSSSHTAGAARLGKMARYIFKEHIERVDLTLFGSFAKTYKGHGTDRALVGGLLGFDAEDERIRDAFKAAAKGNLQYQFIESSEEGGHPNEVRFDLYGKNDYHMSIVGRSLGGGRILVTNVNALDVEISGEDYTILTFHHDCPGVIAAVTSLLGRADVNISTMKVFRKRKHCEAVMLINTDSPVEASVMNEIQKNKDISSVMYFEPLEKAVTE